MALVTTGFKMTVTLVDGGNDVSVLTYNIQEPLYADAVTAGASIRSALNAITDAVIRSYRLVETFQEDTFAFPAGVQIENQAQLTVRLSTLNKLDTIYVPAPVDGLFIAPTGDDYNTVDPTDAALITYLSLFESGAQATLSDGEFITVTDANKLKSGKRIHKASNSG